MEKDLHAIYIISAAILVFLILCSWVLRRAFRDFCEQFSEKTDEVSEGANRCVKALEQIALESREAKDAVQDIQGRVQRLLPTASERAEWERMRKEILEPLANGGIPSDRQGKP